MAQTKLEIELDGVEAAWRGRAAPSGSGLPEAWSPAGGELPVTFRVRPAGGGWLVEGDDLQTLTFAGPAAARRQARRLARCVAALGRDATVSIYDVRNVAVGAIQYFRRPAAATKAIGPSE